MSLTKEITFFTTCKPFRGEADIMQKNALKSWAALGIATIIIGDEKGSKEIAQELKFKHISDVERNSQNIPIVSSLFSVAEESCKTPYLAYLNSDIICDQKSIDGIRQCLYLNDRPDDFLYVTRRINIPCMGDMFDDAHWHSRLKELSELYGTWDGPDAIDVFVYNRGWIGNIPNFVIGRAGWDNWMLGNAQQKQVDIIDGSLAGPVYHPLHGYEHTPNGVADVFTGEIAYQNRSISMNNRNDISSSTTYYLEQGKLKPLENGKNRDDYASLFDVDISKRYFADLRVISNPNEWCIETILGRFFTILWRAKYFIPQRFKSELGQGLKEQVQSEWQETVQLPFNESAEKIQDILLTDFLRFIRECIKAEREIFIWGASVAGQRIYDFLERNGVSIAGYIDNKADKIKSDNKLNILKPAVLHSFKGQKPFIIVGSIYIEEIFQELVTLGYINEIDFTA